MGDGEKAGYPLWSGEVLAWRCGHTLLCAPLHLGGLAPPILSASVSSSAERGPQQTLLQCV